MHENKERCHNARKEKNDQQQQPFILPHSRMHTQKNTKKKYFLLFIMIFDYYFMAGCALAGGVKKYANSAKAERISS